MTGSELRSRFLEFFRSKGHTVAPSDSLVPLKDPSLLFTGAGMNPFKECFLGLRRDLKRAASCQKCFRTGDVEQVGLTPGHLTFFEMLGNFSFGDYFKKEACLWAWEFMTRELKVDPGRLWVSVYESDEEAASVWKDAVGVPAARIVRLGAKENFWPSNAPPDGPNGPCGPCSEIYFDTGCCAVGRVCPEPDHCRPGCPCGRFVEVWNLVFTQYDRQPDGRLLPLPAKNIDTGMGLERLAAVMQGKMSVFETDLFQPIVEAIKTLVRSSTGPAPDSIGGSERTEPVTVSSSNRDRPALYAVADHVRALTFLVGDGVIPSNEGRGYVLRMLLRKAERAGLVGLGLETPFLYRLVPVATRIMEAAYPELTQRRESIAQVILSEEEKFRQMLEEKMPLLRQEIHSAVRPELVEGRTVVVRQAHHDRRLLSAETAARFYDTHGVSYEEIVEVCLQEQVEPPPRAEFDKALTGLQASSRAASRFEGAIFAPDRLAEILAGLRGTEFVGAAGSPQIEARVVALAQELRSVREVRAPAGVEVVLDRTPFYGEAGGQVGDAGLIQAAEGKLRVDDTQWVGSALVHRAKLLEGRLRVGDPVTATVDEGRRRRTARNHTATHLLHAALRRVLGEHVVQAGSRVAPDHLRLDFSHPRALSSGQRESVESLVNEWVERNVPVRVDEMALDEARKAGALALFGEKYGSQVRVVSIGDVSKELCGGTHVERSGDVELLAIVEEGSIASGVRRIEALSAQAALDSLESEVARLQQDQDRLMKRNRRLEEEKGALKVKGAA